MIIFIFTLISIIVIMVLILLKINNWLYILFLILLNNNNKILMMIIIIISIRDKPWIHLWYGFNIFCIFLSTTLIYTKYTYIPFMHEIHIF